MARVEEAIDKIENGTAADDVKDGILYKLLKVDKKVAIIMASDMVLAGVDTVRQSNNKIEKSNSRIDINNVHLLDSSSNDWNIVLSCQES